MCSKTEKIILNAITKPVACRDGTSSLQKWYKLHHLCATKDVCIIPIKYLIWSIKKYIHGNKIQQFKEDNRTTVREKYYSDQKTITKDGSHTGLLASTANHERCKNAQSGWDTLYLFFSMTQKGGIWFLHLVTTNSVQQVLDGMFLICSTNIRYSCLWFRSLGILTVQITQSVVRVPFHQWFFLRSSQMLALLKPQRWSCFMIMYDTKLRTT